MNPVIKGVITGIAVTMGVSSMGYAGTKIRDSVKTYYDGYIINVVDQTVSERFKKLEDAVGNLNSSVQNLSTSVEDKESEKTLIQERLEKLDETNTKLLRYLEQNQN